MKYLVTLKPLESFLFGGDQTFGALDDKNVGSYLFKSREFPQQTALLGMLKKELMIQAGLLTRKRKGEWVDKHKKSQANKLVGVEKFDMLSKTLQDFGSIKSISPLFLFKGNKKYIKKVAIDKLIYDDGKLEGYDPKKDIYDNYISVDGNESLSRSHIFKAVEQTGNKKGGEDNSLFKKISYMLINGFKFAFYLELDEELKDSMVTLGADRSSFLMQVKELDDSLEYQDPKGYLTLLSDAYIRLPLEQHCSFAITSEVSQRNLIGKKSSLKTYKDNNGKSTENKKHFQKSETLYLYEKGSVIINPSNELIEDLKQENLQQIGYNIYTTGEEK